MSNGFRAHLANRLRVQYNPAHVGRSWGEPSELAQVTEIFAPPGKSSRANPGLPAPTPPAFWNLATGISQPSIGIGIEPHRLSIPIPAPTPTPSERHDRVSPHPTLKLDHLNPGTPAPLTASRAAG
jgi:hypothetical protein